MKKLVIAFVLLMIVPVVSAIDLELLNTDPAPPVAGDYVDITVRLNDSGNEVYRNLAVSVVESSDIQVVGTNTKLVSEFRSGSYLTHTFRIFLSENVPGGDVEIPFQVTSDRTNLRKEVEIFVQDSDSLPDIRIGEIVSVPDELIQDTDDNELTFTLQNLGETDAELVSTELQLNSKNVIPSHSFSLTDSVASIGAGQEAELEYSFDILEGQQSDIPYTLDVRYRSRQNADDTYRVFEDSIKGIIPLSKSPFLEIVKVEQGDLKTGTTDNQIFITVKNTGEKEAESVRVRLFPDISYPFIIDSTTLYVSSNIEPGEEQTVVLELEVTRRGITRTYPVEVEIESLVGQTLYTREDQIVLDVEEAPSLSNRAVGFMIIGGVIVLAILIGFFNKRAQKKKGK